MLRTLGVLGARRSGTGSVRCALLTCVLCGSDVYGVGCLLGLYVVEGRGFFFFC